MDLSSKFPYTNRLTKVIKMNLQIIISIVALLAMATMSTRAVPRDYSCWLVHPSECSSCCSKFVETPNGVAYKAESHEHGMGCMCEKKYGSIYDDMDDAEAEFTLD